MKYDLFVDESCHLEHDSATVMCIGYVKVPRLAYHELKEKLISIKHKHNMHKELKWSKFSKAKLALYKELVDFFFADPLEFRCVLVKYKERLNHEDFNRGSHDNYYYKMTYYLLLPNPPGVEYRVFLDIKDTRGKEKLNKIQEVFDNKHHGQSPFIHFQHLRSHENEFFQLTDLFIGAVTYKSRLKKQEQGLIENPHKLEFIKYLEDKSGFSLDETVPPWETKFNIFNHQPKKQ
jgi:hypothetical protein